jgi:acyl-coenzyme A thioesterase PaaI-like protein
MTDVPPPGPSVPGRLGVVVEIEEDGLRFTWAPSAEALHHGRIRASIHAYLADVAAGNLVDNQALWTLTTELSVRSRPLPAPELVTATARLLRDGKRSAVTTVEIASPDDLLLASGAVAFARVPRKPGDPEKPSTTPEDTVVRFASRTQRLAAPIREEAGIRSVDPEHGVVEVEVVPQLRNANGTLQGAMVALVVEAAAEDLVQSRFGVAAVVTDLEVRYLDRVVDGIVGTTARLLGDDPTAPIEIALHARGRTTTHAYARAAVVAS